MRCAGASRNATFFAPISLTSSGRQERMFISAHHKTPQPGVTNMVIPNRKRILLVDDFDEGLRLAQQQDFDLYILDNWLPDRSGVELCRSIRKFDPDTPILFYSAAAYARDIREGMRAGAQAYLVKPVFPNELRQAIAQLISAPSETAS